MQGYLGEEEEWTRYRRIRNDCTRMAKSEKTKYYRELFISLHEEKDSKRIHSVTRDLLGWNRDMGPKNFLSHGRIIRKPKELANEQLTYYQEKMDKLMNELENMPGQKGDPVEKLEEALEKWPQRGQFSEFRFREITIIETSRLVSGLGNSTSHGHDDIDANFLKIILPYIVKPLNYLVNTSLSTKTFANKWRISQVHPLLKEKDMNRMDPGSYRPVSMLPTTSKIVERAVQLQLLNFMESTGQMNDSCHAYRSGLSTTTTIAEISDSLYSATEEKLITEIMTMDQSSAFDCLNFEILLRKMKLYNVSNDVIDWMRSYLNYRTQYVTVGTADSRMRPLTRGVPQGSVLGPLLYVIYTNEISEVVREKDCGETAHLDIERLFGKPCKKCGMTTTYADDTTYVVANSKREDNEEKLRTNLMRMKSYLRDNDLCLNPGKTKLLECMISQKKGKMMGQPPTLVVETGQGTRKEIVDTGHLRILGANLMANMTWASHLETGSKALLPGIRRQLGAFQHLGRKLPRSCRKILAATMIMSRIMYLMPVWGGTTDNYVRKVQVLQNKTARWVTGLQKKTRIKDLLVACGWFSVRELIDIHTTLVIWKLVHMKKPGHLSRNMNVQEDLLIEVNENRLQFTDRSLTSRGTSLWNRLPSELREIRLVANFKRKLKQWTMEQRSRDPNPDPD